MLVTVTATATNVSC
ncbi:hypothetical protein, partial [Flavobacterium weaverense]